MVAIVVEPVAEVEVLVMLAEAVAFARMCASADIVVVTSILSSLIIVGLIPDFCDGFELGIVMTVVEVAIIVVVASKAMSAAGAVVAAVFPLFFSELFQVASEKPKARW